MFKFVSKFYDIVHKQPYLDSFQKRTYFTQHLKGEALKSVEGFCNGNQYVSSLQKLKYLFSNKVVVAQSVNHQRQTSYRIRLEGHR